MVQVFSCVCPADTSGREGYENFGDSIKKELDTYYYRTGQRNFSHSHNSSSTKEYMSDFR